MTAINYDRRIFRSVSNTPNGEVTGETLFHYAQDGDIVTGTYSGGAILQGTLIATVNENGVLDMRYAHVNITGELMTGVCRSVPELLEDGRIRLHETWRWTCADEDAGSSIVEELFEAEQ